MNFYEETIKKAVNANIIDPRDKILVIAAGDYDRQAFLANKFENVLITNLDYDKGVKLYAPYMWEKQDAENLSYPDDEFDWVFVHAGLHHCASPHKALCEMLRVARKGIGVFEARDSVLNKIGNRFGIVAEYEIEPSVLSNAKYGGWRNTPIPNYVYRWTEREVKKTVNSFLPQYIHQYYFYYGLLIPTQRLAMSASVLKRFVARSAELIGPIFKRLFPKQCNNFAFIVTKYGTLQPWLKTENTEIQFRLDYIKGRYHPERFNWQSGAKSRESGVKSQESGVEPGKGYD